MSIPLSVTHKLYSHYNRFSGTLNYFFFSELHQNKPVVFSDIKPQILVKHGILETVMIERRIYAGKTKVITALLYDGNNHFMNVIVML